MTSHENDTMKPNFDKNLSLPWTPQGEKASRNSQIHVFPSVLYQFVDLADQAVVADS